MSVQAVMTPQNRLRRRLEKLAREAWNAARGTLWFQFFAIVLLVIFIHWSLLISADNYLTWGNYLLPFTASQYATLGSMPGGWNQFEYMGAPLVVPFQAVIGYFTSTEPLSFFSFIAGPTTAAKLYAILSTSFLGLTFLLLSRTLIRNYWAQLISSRFLRV